MSSGSTLQPLVISEWKWECIAYDFKKWSTEIPLSMQLYFGYYVAIDKISSFHFDEDGLYLGEADFDEDGLYLREVDWVIVY